LKTLEEYLRDSLKAGVIDHSLRAQIDIQGRLTFYIHPAGVSGDTLDFSVTGNTLNPAGWNIEASEVIKGPPCPHCNSTGVFNYGDERCSLCHGNGFLHTSVS
jgi:hypothetical protein